MTPIRIDVKILYQHAHDCDRMAGESSDLFTHNSLRELAAEFRCAAQTLERRTKPPQVRHNPPRRPLSLRRGSADERSNGQRGFGGNSAFLGAINGSHSGALRSSEPGIE